MPRKRKGTKTPPDRDSIVMGWIEQQESVSESVADEHVGSGNVIEMPLSPEERKRRLERARTAQNERNSPPRSPGV